MVTSRLLRLYRLYKRASWPGGLATRRFIAKTATLRAPAEVRVCLDIGAGVAPRRAEISRQFAVKQYVALDFVLSDAVSVIADARHLPVRDHSVDLVICFEVLQHIADYRTVLDEMKRVLRPGGNVMLSFPFIYGECDVVDFRRWTVAGMSREFEERGFTVLSADRRGGLFFAMTTMLIWAIQHSIPGARMTWRATRTPAAYAREAMLALLTFPFVVLGWLAFTIDGLLPQSGCYTGALIFARLGST